MHLSATQSSADQQGNELYQAVDEPFYLPVGDEVSLFEAAYRERIPVLLKGPTGCGKTRFVEYMAWHLAQKAGAERGYALTTVSCHEDLTATDLVGRYLLSNDGTHWIDGPLTRAVRSGGICYLDEVVEARKDTIVVIHSLTDHRRLLPIEKKGELIVAVVVSFAGFFCDSIARDLIGHVPPGDVAVWDNRCVLHRACVYDYTERRVMKHTRVAGEATEIAAHCGYATAASLHE